ncbi:dihydroorotase [candidate division WOR-3 bacterium]|nr:dihydroorotase [candidate division WOR-3 bacterium]
MSDRYVIHGGYAFFPQEKALKKVDIEIAEGRIKKIAATISPESDAKAIEAENKLISPGLIDLHVHLREPGREDTETLETGAWAALAGGFTTVCAMPNTCPPTDTREQAAFISKRSEELGLARILPIGTVTKKREGVEIAEYGMLKEGGVIAVSDDGDWIVSAEVMRRALEYAGMLGLPVITHAEEPTMCADGVMNESTVSARLGLKVRPSVAEEVALERDIALAAYTGSHLHVAHLTTARGVQLVREARSRDVKVTAEATPHHLLLTDEKLSEFDANFKVNPPLRTEEDRKALVAALKDGTIQAIATDHAPHPLEEKEQELDLAPAGMIGLQTALSVLWEALIDTRTLAPERLLALLTVGPAEVLGRKLELKEGEPADLMVFDPGVSWVFDAESNRSLSQNSPWFGKTLKGKVQHVFLAEKHFEF